MYPSDWFRPPRHVLTIFLAIALVCGGALGWLGWLLLQQDNAVEAQRRTQQVEDAADHAVVIMQQSLATLESRLSGGGDGINLRGVSVISVAPGGSIAYSGEAIPYFPEADLVQQAPATAFAETDRLEFAARDLSAAATASETLSRSLNPAIRAGALVRLARIYRKLHNGTSAEAAYDRLASLTSEGVDGLPAGLIVREGRTSLFADLHRSADLARESNALLADLRSGRWQLTREQYEFYFSEAAKWLGTTAPEDPEAIARAEALSWLWQYRESGDGTSRRLVRAGGSPVLVAWSRTPNWVFHAVIAGPDFITAMTRRAASSSVELALADFDGRAILGPAPPARGAAVRTSAVTGLPWSVSVFPAIGSRPPFERKRLLMWVFGVLAIVLSTGTYFILRAISREIRVSRLQSDFVSAVSHEFRSPLSSMAQITEMLARDRFPSEELRRRSYDILSSETTRLRRLVENLLDFARFEKKNAGYHFETVEAGAFLRDIVADFAGRAAERGYSVELAAPAGEIPVCADREALARAVWNLLDNAVKYSPECRTVWVEMRREPGRVAIAVHDRGLGIPAAEQREIFEKFVRGAQSKALHIKGTGVGLAMVRSIVQAHGGEIQLASEPGKGSRFTVVLRAVEAS